MKKPKILIWDIETSYNIATTFSLFPKYISHDNILQDWYIICAAWKWLGDTKTHVITTLDDQGDNADHKNDIRVVEKMRSLLLEADVVVHHNGDKFDLKKLNTRLIYHRLDPLPTKLTTVDTLKAAKKTFAFSSNRLDYLGAYLGLGRKLHTDSSLWMDSLKGDVKAINKMAKYNKQDVDLLEAVFNVMRPYIKMPNLAAQDATTDLCCNDCSSSSVQKRGYLFFAAGKKQRYQCTECGKWGHSPNVINKTQLRPL